MQITIEIPDDTPANMIERLKDYAPRLATRDWLASWWHISDVYDIADSIGIELDSNQAADILKIVGRNEDSEIGINRDVIEFTIENYLVEATK
jgi:hypothetical protein